MIPSMHEFFPFLMPLFRIAAAIGVVAAVFFAFKLYRETDKVWYWGALLLSASFMALGQWLFILMPLVHNFPVLNIFQDVSNILASAFFAIACYGMYSAMHKIRKRVE